MKKITLSLIILLSLTSFRQAQVKSGVYNAEAQKPDSKGQRTILTGETRFFSFYELTLISLPKKKKDNPSPTTVDYEQVVIVMDGALKVTLGTEDKVLTRGGVAHVLPGDLVAFENAGDAPVNFYVMKFRNRDQGNTERGKTNGGSVVMRWEDVEKKTTANGFSRIFYNHPTTMTTKFDMHATTLKKGIASHAPHTHAEEEIVLMLRGKGSMHIDGKLYDVAPGQLIYLSSEISHAIENSGDDECEYFAFQWK